MGRATKECLSAFVPRLLSAFLDTTLCSWFLTISRVQSQLGKTRCTRAPDEIWSHPPSDALSRTSWQRLGSFCLLDADSPIPLYTLRAAAVQGLPLCRCEPCALLIPNPPNLSVRMCRAMEEGLIIPTFASQTICLPKPACERFDSWISSVSLIMLALFPYLGLFLR